MQHALVSDPTRKQMLVNNKASQMPSTNHHLPKDLPEDILREIFLLNAKDPSHKLADRALTTLSCSHVCQAWRQISLSYAYLWTHVIDYRYHPIRWISELLERSSPFPLDLDAEGHPLRWVIIDPEDRRSSLFEPLFLQHKDRWRSVCIGDLPYEDHPSFQIYSDYLLCPSPVIGKLHLEDTHWCGRLISRVLFADRAPCLRSLDLNQICLNLNASPSLGNQLEELTLRWDSDLAPDIPSYSGWLRFLGNAPRLRYLLLRFLAPADAGEVLADLSGPILLKRLRLLCLAVESPEACKATMDHLVIPPNCGLMIFCWDMRRSSDKAWILDIVRSRVDLWDDNTTSRVLHARYLGGTQCRISFRNCDFSEGWPSERGFEEIRNGNIVPAGPPLMITVESQVEPNELSFFMRLFSLFEASFSTTIALRLQICTGLPLRLDDYPSFLSGLEKFDNLKTLAINDQLHSDLFPTLMRGHANTKTIPFPSLQIVEFLQELDRRLTWRDAEHIRDFLRWRINQGVPVSAIDIRNCMPMSVIKRWGLQNLVEVVGADG